MVNIISQDTKIDADLRAKVERKRLYICKLHCTADQVIRRKFKYNIHTFVMRYYNHEPLKSNLVLTQKT